MNRRLQALKQCLDSSPVVGIKIVNQPCLEVLDRHKFLEVEQLAFEMAKEILHDSIVQAVALDVYGHVTQDMKRDSAQRMEGFIKGVLNL